MIIKAEKINNRAHLVLTAENLDEYKQLEEIYTDIRCMEFDEENGHYPLPGEYSDSNLDVRARSLTVRIADEAMAREIADRQDEEDALYGM